MLQLINAREIPGLDSGRVHGQDGKDCFTAVMRGYNGGTGEKEKNLSSWES